MADEGRKRKMQRKKGANLMKKLFKKISAILIAAVMVLARASTAFADGENGLSAEIIINNAEHATFSYLQVIKPNSQKETG